MSKKSDKYLKINGNVVRLPKKGYTASLDATVARACDIADFGRETLDSCE